MSLSQAGTQAYRPTFNQGTDAKPRWIRPPRDELKRVQRQLLRSFFPDIPPHDASFAAKRRGGAVGAANQHVSHPWLLHLDLSKFFPSVAPSRVLERLRVIGVREDTANLLTDLVTVAGELPQGAPTSPAVADLVLFPMDSRIAVLATQHGWSYTRYVDDIALSGGESVGTFGRRMVMKIVAEEGWVVNDKGGLFGPADGKKILGLTIGSRVGVPAKYRQRIRSRLRLASAGKISLTASEIESIRGQVARIFAINPQQGRRLRLFVDAVETG